MKSFDEFVNESKRSDINLKIKELKNKLKDTNETISEVKKKMRNEKEPDKQELFTLSLQKYAAKLQMIDADIEINKIKRTQL
tara:strand:+ start:258 stop:503 length:246 start_codon:yes stop_codon:yes gene_type:complete